jgi:hypothetical protein
MKINEIISEGVGRAADHPEHATHANTGEWQFRDHGGYYPTYNLNRVMMAAAMADGSNKKLDVDEASWVSVYNVARPYTEQEHKMMQQAFRAINSEVHHTETDHKSYEHPETHTVSPHRKVGPIKRRK